MDQERTGVGKRPADLLPLRRILDCGSLSFRVGLYSVLSYSVAQRSNEFGIRMALGATRQHVLKVVTASAGRSVGTGIAVGLILSFSLSRVVSTWVGGTTNHPVIVFGVSLLLLVVAGVACFVPACKALSIDPIAALRSE